MIELSQPLYMSFSYSKYNLHRLQLIYLNREKTLKYQNTKLKLYTYHSIYLSFHPLGTIHNHRWYLQLSTVMVSPVKHFLLCLPQLNSYRIAWFFCIPVHFKFHSLDESLRLKFRYFMVPSHNEVCRIQNVAEYRSGRVLFLL